LLPSLTWPWQRIMELRGNFHQSNILSKFIFSFIFSKEEKHAIRNGLINKILSISFCSLYKIYIKGSILMHTKVIKSLNNLFPQTFTEVPKSLDFWHVALPSGCEQFLHKSFRKII
jgi:hypothetical protein